MRLKLLGLAYAIGVFGVAALALNYISSLAIVLLSLSLCSYWGWKLTKLQLKWSFTFVGTICFTWAALCIVVDQLPVSGTVPVPTIYLSSTFVGASLAAVDVVRKKGFAPVSICIANLGLLLPYLIGVGVHHFI